MNESLNLRMLLDSERMLTRNQGLYMALRHDSMRASASNYKGTSKQYYQRLVSSSLCVLECNMSVI